MILASEISLDVVVLNDARFSRAEPLENYISVLGPPSRSEMLGPPPPYGHRNNVAHFYDDIGLILREHHATRLIEGIEFLFEPSKWQFPTTSSYSGEMRVFGLLVHTGMDFHEFADQCEISFSPHLGHAWFIDGDQLSLQFEVFKPKKKQPPQSELIVALCVGFRNQKSLAGN